MPKLPLIDSVITPKNQSGTGSNCLGLMGPNKPNKFPHRLFNPYNLIKLNMIHQFENYLKIAQIRKSGKFDSKINYANQPWSNNNGKQNHGWPNWPRNQQSKNKKEEEVEVEEVEDGWDRENTLDITR